MQGEILTDDIAAKRDSIESENLYLPTEGSDVSRA